MLSAAEISRTVPSDGHLVVLIKLNSLGQVIESHLQGEISFSEKDIQSSIFINSVLPFSFPAVEAAVDAAGKGRPSKTSYWAEFDGRKYFWELHCFPAAGVAGAVECVLIDRTAEGENAARLQARIYMLDIINQMVKAFAETRNLSDILRIVLLGVTAGPGLGFNRGFVLLSSESRSCLWGCLATGPSTAEEAGSIWQDLAARSLTLEEILRLYKSSGPDAADIHVNRLVASLKIPLSDESNFIVRAAKEGRSLITGPEMMECPSNRELRNKFGTDRLAVIPLISREGLQGVLLADNLITGKPITEADLRVLEIFGKYASDAIENSRLYGRLEQQICRLKEANEKIIQSRENLIKAEKLSSVAKMALEVAHEIRNPLTVIGGYANSHLNKIGPEDQSRAVFEIISRQTGRIERALDRFSSVVSLSEKKEGRFRLLGLIREMLGMLATSASPDLPLLSSEPGVEESEVFVDQGLFNEAMMVILRKASDMAGGMPKIVIQVARQGQAGTIFILGGDDRPKFAEEFYRSLRNSKGDLRNQEMAVALEILQHYGAGIGIVSQDKNPMRLYVEFPLCKEG